MSPTACLRRRPPRTRGRHSAPRRRGAVILEWILVVCILTIVMLAFVQFAIMLLVQQAVSHAATVGAREAGKGGEADQIATCVNAVMAVHCLSTDDGEVEIFVERDGGTFRIGDIQGPLCGPAPGVPAPLADEARVTVCVDLLKAPFCNLLLSFGIDIGIGQPGCRLQYSSLVKNE